jgi:hypothetical protein
VRFPPPTHPELRSRTDDQVSVTVPALSVQVFKAEHAIARSHAAPAVHFRSPSAGGVLADRAEIRAAVPANTFAEASFAFRPVGTSAWQSLGSDDNAPYRVFHDVSGLAKGTLLEYRVVVRDNAGHLSATSSYGIVGDAPKAGGGSGVGDVTQPQFVSVPGSGNSELGCPADWSPDCPQAQLSLDANDHIWKGTFTFSPAGSYAYKAAINKTWDENYGAGGVLNGANIEFTSDGTTPITFFYDHRTHYVSSTAEKRWWSRPEASNPRWVVPPTMTRPVCGPGCKIPTTMGCSRCPRLRFRPARTRHRRPGRPPSRSPCHRERSPRSAMTPRRTF